MSSKGSINENLEHFKIDQDKTGINEDVHDPSKWPDGHLALAEGHTSHRFPSPRFVVAEV